MGNLVLILVLWSTQAHAVNFGKWNVIAQDKALKLAWAQTLEEAKKHMTAEEFKTYKAKFKDRPTGFTDAIVCKEDRERALKKGEITQEQKALLEEYKLGLSFDAKGKVSGIGGYCGCFHPATQLLAFENETLSMGSISAGDLVGNEESYRLAHLSEDAKLSQFDFKLSQIAVTSAGKESLPLVVINTDDGKTLKITTQHAVMLASGQMVQAKDLDEKSLLLDRDGNILTIKSIGSETFEGDVVNFEVNSDSEQGITHVIFAQDIAVGDLAWQNRFALELDREIIRQ